MLQHFLLIDFHDDHTKKKKKKIAMVFLRSFSSSMLSSVSLVTKKKKTRVSMNVLSLERNCYDNQIGFRKSLKIFDSNESRSASFFIPFSCIII